MTMLVLAIVAAIGFLGLGLYLLRRRQQGMKRDAPVTGGWGDFFLSAPVPVFFVLLAIVLVASAFWQLNSRFPADAEAFTGASRTLGSIAEGLRRNSNADIQLKGDADTVLISQPVSGACATALLDNLCDKYRGTLTCSQEGNRRVIERSR